MAVNEVRCVDAPKCLAIGGECCTSGLIFMYLSSAVVVVVVGTRVTQ